MGYGRTNAWSGGSGKSEIIVTAPTGSAVTATCGTTVKTAAEKAGEWIFRNCDLGTWKIEARLSGKSVTETLEIKQEGQLVRYYVKLDYWTATISVSYPAGAVCTCSNGTTTLTAPDTSGSHVFSVHSAGDWVIKIIADGKPEKSMTVNVSEETDYTVNISFSLTLYTAGDECTDVSGGWGRVSGEHSVGNTPNGLRIEITSDYGSTSNVLTKNKIDLSSYSELRVTIAASYGPTSARIVVRDTADVASVDANKNGTSTLDVSGLNGAYYVGVCVASNKQYTVMDVKEVVLT